MSEPISAIPAGVAFVAQMVKTQLCNKGLIGYVQFQRMFRQFHNNISIAEFKYVMKELRVAVKDSELRVLFEFFCDPKKGGLDNGLFLRAMLPSLNDRRKRIVSHVFTSLDKGGKGMIRADDVASIFDPSQHPEVLSGRMTANGVLAEFLESFDVGAEVDEMVTFSEFVGYYAVIGAAISNDDYFELMLRNTWHVYDGADSGDNVATIAGSHEQEMERLRSMRRGPLHLDDTMSQQQVDELPVPPAAARVRPPSSPERGHRPPAPRQMPSSSPISPNEPSHGIKHVIVKLRTRLKSFGPLGYVTLEHTLRTLDSDNTKLVTLSELKHAVSQMDIALGDVELRQLFEHLDTRGMQAVNISELLRGIRELLSGARLHLVRAAFARLDKDGRGVVDASLLAQSYDPFQHPEVISGRSTADSVLSEFMSTFDVGGDVDGKVTLPEFVNYYSNIGANIDSDEYFELLVRSVWGVRGVVPGLSEPTRHVLVTRTDGAKYMEEVRGQEVAEEEEEEEGRGGVHRMTKINKRRSFVPPATDGVFGHGAARASFPTPAHNPLKAAVIQNAANKVGSVFQPCAGVQVLLDRLRRDIKECGVHSLIGLQRKLREVAAAPSSGVLTLSEFKRAFKETYWSWTDADLRLMFADFDLDGDGLVDVEFFLRNIRAPLNNRRLACVKRAFAQLDAGAVGVIEATGVAAAYDASRHPEVVAGRMSAEHALQQFLETFDVGSEVDGMVTAGEFANYYATVGSTVASDSAFEDLVNGVWNVDASEPTASVGGRGEKEPLNPALIATVAGLRTRPSGGGRIQWGDAAGAGGQFDGVAPRPQRHGREADSGVQLVITRLRAELRRRGAVDGLIALRRRLRAALAGPSAAAPRLLNLTEFTRAVRDMELPVVHAEIRVVFDHFDAKGNGLVDCADVVGGLRRRLEGRRLQLVTDAFGRLDVSGVGSIDAVDIIDLYDPAAHPDVLLGVRSADSVMDEWLGSFDVGSEVDGRVTLGEFVEFFASHSSTIEDDDYFEVLVSAWRKGEKTRASVARPHLALPPPPPVPAIDDENDVTTALTDSMRNWRDSHADVSYGKRSDIGKTFVAASSKRMAFERNKSQISFA